MSAHFFTTLAEAKRSVPWASHFVKCDGGYWAFSTAHDYRVWRDQQ